MIFETHAHYDDEKFEQDANEILLGLKDKGIGEVVNVGASMQGSKKSVELSEKYSFVYAAVGVHPTECAMMTQEDIDWLEEALSFEKTVALGEIGLDYYWDDVDKQTQKKWFIRQLELAVKTQMPVIIHSRDAAKDTLDIINEYSAKIKKMVIHCFSYEKEMAKKYLDKGYYIGVGGVVTFNNARKLREVVEFAPIDKILLETDSPYLAPVPNRGKRNDSSNLIYVAQAIAQMKKMEVEKVIEITRQNAINFYGLTI